MNIKYDMFLLLALMGTASAGAQNKKAAKPKAKTTAVRCCPIRRRYSS